jgi:hypothetical protein
MSVTPTPPPPPPVLAGLITLQLRPLLGKFQGTAPVYVVDAAKAFLAALEKWAGVPPVQG